MEHSHPPDNSRSVFHDVFRSHAAMQPYNSEGKDMLDKKRETIDVTRVIMSKEWVSMLSGVGTSHPLVTAVIAYLAGRTNIVRSTEFQRTETSAALDFLEVNKERVIYEMTVYGMCVIGHCKSSADVILPKKPKSAKTSKRSRTDGDVAGSGKSGMYPDGTSAASNSEVHNSEIGSSSMPSNIRMLRPDEYAPGEKRKRDGDENANEDEESEYEADGEFIHVDREPTLVSIRGLYERGLRIHAICSGDNGVPESYFVFDPEVGVLPDFTVIAASHAPLYSHKMQDTMSQFEYNTFQESDTATFITKMLLYPPAASASLGDFNKSTTRAGAGWECDNRIGYVRSPLTRALPLINELFRLKERRWQSYKDTNVSRVLLTDGQVEKDMRLFASLATHAVKADNEDVIENQQRAVDGLFAMFHKMRENAEEEARPVPTSITDYIVGWDADNKLPPPAMKMIPAGLVPTVIPPTNIIETEKEEKDIIAQIGAALGLHSTVFIPYSAHYAGSNLSDDTHATNASLEMMRASVVKVISSVAALHFAERHKDVYVNKFDVAFSTDKLNIMGAMEHRTGSRHLGTRYRANSNQPEFSTVHNQYPTKSEIDIVALNAASAHSTAIFTLSVPFAKDIRASLKIGAPMPVVAALLEAEPAFSQIVAQQIGFPKPDIPPTADTPGYPAAPPKPAAPKRK